MESVDNEQWLPLAEGGDFSKWVLDPDDAIEVDHYGVVRVLKNAKGEVGGMSWDNYVLSCEVRLTRLSEDWYFQVELTAVGSCVYCQLLPSRIVLCSYLEGGEGDKDHHSIENIELVENSWHELKMIAQHGHITAVLDGKEVTEAASPLGTAGMAGFIVKFIKNAEVRLRNLRVRFLSPTAEQFEEYGRDALTNWRNHEEAQQAPAGDVVNAAPEE